ncbi:hypothetical protein EYD10_01452 [Varanus komodoensis]|nr:hypothetical protein EYD10_01452 [Varanus komodoensis]
MKNQSCKPCAEATYSLGTGIRFDEWDELPHGFASTAANLEIDYSFTEPLGNCSMSTWVPKGDYIASNTDECTATLMYAVNLKQSGTVSFEYIYTDSSIVQNDQCQPSVEESRWMRTSDRGWETHSVELSRGNNVLYWRTTAFSVWSKTPKPVLVRNIGITGCINCPVGTEPAVGFEYKWWNTLPANMETTVLSGISFEYKGMAGWEVAGDYIYTAAGASDNDFMILTLVIPGFSPPQSVMEDSENKKIATITFVFETICSVNCELYFMVIL